VITRRNTLCVQLDINPGLLSLTGENN